MGATATDCPGKRILFWESGPLSLESGAAEVVLAGPEGACEEAFAQSGRQRFKLMLTGLHSNLEPEVAFAVFLNPVPGVKSTRKDIGYVSDLNFFGLTRTERPFSIDVSEALGRLKQGRRAACPIVVAFQTNGAVAKGSRPTIRVIELWRAN